ncbi:NAT4 [Candida jiufengensis]|uniref:NAT4 n=1 Tax=Candida jiufengensis TaxID=497108 RepID=UPI0022256C3E|nr:NAT4 [Candida jiufengensis]KAI5955290.1 NAT4 [Candida jiufengensis]
MEKFNTNFNFSIDDQEFEKFDEEDFSLMEAIAEDITSNYLSHLFSVPGFRTRLEVVDMLQEEEIERFIDIIDENIGDLYVRNKGSDWREEKEEELTEPGLIYVWLSKEEDEEEEDKDEVDKDEDEKETNKFVAYLCFKLCLDDEDKLVLYLYEIHVVKDYQGQKLGQALINRFHELTLVLKGSANNLYEQVEGTALTVFSSNEKALNWYTKMGYRILESSPQGKKLRNGKITKPSYYLMSRSAGY